MTERDLLELIATQVNKLTKDVDELKANMSTKQELESVKSIVVRIENEHGLKLAALFDGQNLNSDKLDRIEKEVSRHEEIIMRRNR